MADCALFPLKTSAPKKIQAGPKLPLKPDALPDCIKIDHSHFANIFEMSGDW